MTDDLTPILEDLRGVDFETWKDVKFALVNACLSIDSPGRTLIEESTRSDIIQGCIQRAIAARDWSYKQGLRRTDGMYWAIVDRSGCPGKRIFTAIPTAAILAAYIAAKKVNA